MQYDNAGINPERERAQVREFLLSNAAFERFARGFEVCQRVLHDKKMTVAEREAAHARMHELYTPRMTKAGSAYSFIERTAGKIAHARARLVENEAQKRNAEAEKISHVALDLCEANQFTKEQLADMFVSASSGFFDAFLREWDPKAGRDVSGRNIVNEIMAFRYMNDDTLTLDVLPTPVKGNIFEKIQEGCALVAQMMKEGTIQVKQVFLESWLLGSVFEEKVRALLGENIKFLEVDEESTDVARIHHQALFYNEISLDRYLRKGKKPEVRAVYMTSEEFIKQFAG